MKIAVENVETIFSDGRHNMNPSICRWKDNYYVAFRSAITHSAPNETGWEGARIGGHIKIIKSADLKNWSHLIVIDTEWDDRDPKLLVTDDRLCVYAVAMRADGGQQTFMSFTEDGTNWHAAQEVYKHNYAFWGLYPKEHNGAYYVAADVDDSPEGTPVAERGRVELLSSTDGVNWQHVSIIVSGYCCTETPFVFLKDDSLLAVTRVDQKAQSWISGARPPYTQWDHWEGLYVGGPAAALVGDTVLVAGRQGGGQTALLELQVDTMKLELLMTMPAYRWGAAGDKSCPDFLVVDDHRFLLAYYDGEPWEEGVPKQADIRLATLALF